MIIDLSKETIDKIFEDETKAKTPHQGNILINLYKVAFPDWDKIESLSGWPKVNKVTWQYIGKKFRDFDQIYHPKVMAGGCWLNSGFGNKDNVPDWKADLSEVQVKYIPEV